MKKEKWSDRVKQYGYRAALSQVVRAMIRPVYDVREDVVLAKDNKKYTASTYSEICCLNEGVIKNAIKIGQISQRKGDLLIQSLNEDSYGYAAIIDNYFAGYAIVQTKGTYSFAKTGKLIIPSDMVILKNLFVDPKYRGKSIGKKLNEVRVASVPAGKILIVFVMTENRIALRNQKIIGFKEILIIKRSTWFNKWIRQRITTIHDCYVSRLLTKRLIIKNAMSDINGLSI
jgi:ribosomal protein S18 acetylase RimI-like enzyme